MALTHTRSQFAFHSAAEAVNFCFDVQVELLQIMWPAELLSHPKAAIALQKDMQVMKDQDITNSSPSKLKIGMTRKGKTSSRKSKRKGGAETVTPKKQSKKESDEGLRRIFSGLRVRMALDFGYCDHSVHEVSGRYASTRAREHA